MFTVFRKENNRTIFHNFYVIAQLRINMANECFTHNRIWEKKKQLFQKKKEDGGIAGAEVRYSLKSSVTIKPKQNSLVKKHLITLYLLLQIIHSVDQQILKYATHVVAHLCYRRWSFSSTWSRSTIRKWVYIFYRTSREIYLALFSAFLYSG